MFSGANEEKREFMRMSVETPIKFTVLNNPDKFYSGSSHDFSATGLYFTSTFSPEIDDEIEFIMTPSNKKLPPFIAKATVLSCTSDKGNRKLFHVRVKMSTIS